jgi:hypothetical protein
MQLTVRDLTARIARLDRLVEGLAKEAGQHRGDDDVLLSRERKQYLTAFQKALAGLDEARAVLGKAVKRLEGLPTW